MHHSPSTPQPSTNTRDTKTTTLTPQNSSLNQKLAPKISKTSHNNTTAIINNHCPKSFQTQPQNHHIHNQQPLAKITTTATHHILQDPIQKNQSNSNCQNQIRKTNPPFSMAITVHAKPGSNPIDAKCCCLRERKYRVLSGLTSSSGLARGGGNE